MSLKTNKNIPLKYAFELHRSSFVCCLKPSNFKWSFPVPSDVRKYFKGAARNFRPLFQMQTLHTLFFVLWTRKHEPLSPRDVYLTRKGGCIHHRQEQLVNCLKHSWRCISSYFSSLLCFLPFCFFKPILLDLHSPFLFLFIINSFLLFILIPFIHIFYYHLCVFFPLIYHEESLKNFKLNKIFFSIRFFPTYIVSCMPYCPSSTLQPRWLFVLFQVDYGTGSHVKLMRSRSTSINLFWFVLYSD